MRRICFVNHHYLKYNIGGAEVQMYILAKEFVKRDWDVYYVSEDIPEYQIEDGIKLVPFLPKSNNLIEKNELLSHLLLEINADVYYQRGRREYTYYLARFCVQYNKKFIFAISMNIDCKRNKFLFRRTRKKIYLLKNIIYFKKNFLLDKYSLYGMRNASIVLSQTIQQKSILEKKLKIKSIIIRNVHPIPSNQNITKDKPPLVLWLATIKHWKQPEIFLKCVRKLSKLNCKFIMAGNLLDKNYSIMIKELKNQNHNFHFFNDVSYYYSNELIGKASVFVNTSRLEEGFPNTFIQSWMRKTPTISLNFDPDNVIKRENIGRHSKNFIDLIKDIKEIINDEKLRGKMGENAQNYAKKNFNINIEINKLLFIINSLFQVH